MTIYLNNDLTKNPPRGPRVRLGGYVILPRMLDKGRAEIAGKQGEYKFNCPLDQRFLSFVGVDAAEIKKLLVSGKSDKDILTWISDNAKNRHEPYEIAAWSHHQENRGPADAESQEYFTNLLKKCASHREDISTWFELLDLDDYVSFGGRA